MDTKLVQRGSSDSDTSDYPLPKLSITRYDVLHGSLAGQSERAASTIMFRPGYPVSSVSSISFDP